MNSVFIIIVLEKLQLSTQVPPIPEKQPVQELPAHGSDQPVHKRMRLGRVRNAAHGFNLQDPQIGLPALRLKEPVMIEAQSPGQALIGYGLIEHPT